MPPAADYSALLQERLITYFDRAELADLCLRLGVNFDSLPDASLGAQARELILLLARQERLPEMLAALRAERPTIDWPPVPPDYRPPAASLSPGEADSSRQNKYNIGTVNAGNLAIGDWATLNVNNFSGDFRGAMVNVQSTLRDTRQAVEALPAADDAARADLIRLIGQLERTLHATPPGREMEAEEVAEMARELVEAAGADKSSRATVRRLGAGLKEAAGALADALPSIVEIAARIATVVGSLPS